MSKDEISNTLPDAERKRLSEMVAQHGATGAASILASTRGVIERAVGGLPCRRGSIAILLLGLRSTDKAAR